MEPSITYKILVVGEQDVGKTSIIHRFCDNIYNARKASIDAIDFKERFIQLNGLRVRLKIYDTPDGNEERINRFTMFRKIPDDFYHGYDGVLLLYDFTAIKSFNTLLMWLYDIRNNAPSNVMVLAGNKCDSSPAARMFNEQRVSEIVKDHGLTHFEVSCKNNINITEPFLALVRRISNENTKSSIICSDSQCTIL